MTGDPAVVGFGVGGALAVSCTSQLGRIDAGATFYGTPQSMAATAKPLQAHFSDEGVEGLSDLNATARFSLGAAPGSVLAARAIQYAASHGFMDVPELETEPDEAERLFALRETAIDTLLGFLGTALATELPAHRKPSAYGPVRGGHTEKVMAHKAGQAQVRPYNSV